MTSEGSTNSPARVWTILKWVTAAVTGLALLGPLAGYVQNSRRTVTGEIPSESKLKALVVALCYYHEQERCLPPAAGTEPQVSWRVRLLPYMDQRLLYQSYEQEQAWDSAANSRLAKTWVKWFTSPQHPFQRDEAGRFYANFVAPVGPQTALLREKPRKFEDITDGLSKTIVLVELPNSDIVWTEPRDVSADWQPANGHEKRGRYAAFADGAVRLLPRNMDPDLVRKLLTADGGEDVTGWE